MSSKGSLCAFVLIVLILSAFFLYPLYKTVRGGFFDDDGRFTLEFLKEVFRNPIYMEGLWNSLRLAVATTFVVLCLSVPLAFLSARFQFPAKSWLSGLVLVPMILPPFVGAIGLRQFWGQMGVLNAILFRLGLSSGKPVDWLGINQFWGVVVAQALHLYPVMYLNATAALSNIDPAMDEAARNLGAGRLRRLFTIMLPLMMPGLFAGGTIVFIWAFTELGTPLMFDFNRVSSVQVFSAIKEVGDNPFAYVLVVVIMLSSVCAFLVGKFVAGRHSQVVATKAVRAAQEKRLAGWRAWAATAVFAGVAAVALIPHASVVLMSLSRDWYASILPSQWTVEHYQAALGHAMTVPSIGNSLRYASLATVLDIVIGMAAAWIIVRSKIRGKALLDALVMAPLAVPGLVLAFGYMAMSQPGELFSALDPTENPTILLVIAYAIRRLPYMVRALVAGLQQTGVVFEEAARNLGAGSLRIWRKITLPLIAANVLAGGILVFCFAMLEVSDSLMLAQKQEYFPITKAIYELFQLLGEGRYLAAALGAWSMVFLATGLLLAGRLLGKKMGALFRA